MKIYFAGSIRGGREYVAVFQQIISYLRKYGTILTEHVADMSISSYGEIKPTDDVKRRDGEIYERDISWIHESDIVVAEISTPSLGVGYEIGYAEAKGKPIVACYHSSAEKRASAMIAGNRAITYISYDTVEQLFELLEENFEQIKNQSLA